MTDQPQQAREDWAYLEEINNRAIEREAPVRRAWKDGLTTGLIAGTAVGMFLAVFVLVVL